MLLSAFDLKPVIDLTDEQFYQLCRANPDVKFERDATGKILIMSPSGGTTGNRNFEIAAEFGIWNRQAQLGVCFDSSTGFKLPNGATRAPDVAWIERSRWDALTPEQQEKFPPIAPDFVLELMFPSDTLEETQAKLREYIENGVRLGWLIDRKTRHVEIYRSDQSVEVLDNPTSLEGENVLPGFVLNLAIVW
ncbi:Uma2 family endonuclease [Leptolyngbya sp. FACHB-17]|uniref:Uma2 family endonuclease n=1 Tax=unclassified Leptolyngbya TaxID=2650499 RepID=UPI0016811143|nr:Uma2 family endonuclease [Leptolyngbya sp. FACHB-17]MBD2081155.1 Uma2 family endonuclease [Leptolyngbya sp. FACHB-17]